MKCQCLPVGPAEISDTPVVLWHRTPVPVIACATNPVVTKTFSDADDDKHRAQGHSGKDIPYEFQWEQVTVVIDKGPTMTQGHNDCLWHGQESVPHTGSHNDVARVTDCQWPFEHKATEGKTSLLCGSDCLCHGHKPVTHTSRHTDAFQ